MPRLSLMMLACCLVASSARAQYRVIEPLANELTRFVGTANGRLQSVADGTEIRGKRLTSMIGSAEALYSWTYNQLLLDRDLIRPDGTVATFRYLCELRGGHLGACAAIATVRHELAHAEYDLFIEERVEPEDERLWRVLQDQVRPWLARNEPELNNLPRWLVEWHGYFVEACYQQVLSDRTDILRSHGLNPVTLAVDDTGRQRLRSLVASGRLRREHVGRFVPELVVGVTGTDPWTRSYGQRVRGFSVWALNGLTAFAAQREVSTRSWTAERGFSDAWWEAMWNHLRHYHRLPSTATELVGCMEATMEASLAALAAEERRMLDEVPRSGAPDEPDFALLQMAP